MKKILLTTLLTSAVIIGGIGSAWADTDAIPAKIRDHVLKRHPAAVDLQASEETHFGTKLLKVSYKEGEDSNIELFRSNGTLFSNVLPVEDPTPLPPELIKTLKSQLADYQFKKAELVVNPNSVGEEYTLFVVANNENWRLLINDKGQLLDKGHF